MKTRSGFQTLETITTASSSDADEPPSQKPRKSAFSGTGRTLKSPRSPKSPKKAAASSGIKKAIPKKPASPRKPSAMKSTTRPNSGPASTKAVLPTIDVAKAKKHTGYTPCSPDTAPVQNLYGEPVMPASANQRLQQAIIFLSDEGPENHPRFKDKLKIIEHEIGVVWPTRKRHGDPEFQYDEGLHRKCCGMIRVQRARVDGGYRRWFESTMFPQYPVSDSEDSADYPLAPLPEPAPVAAAAAASPSRGQQGGQEQNGPDADGYYTMTEEEARAYAEDPWAEPLPRAEVWHRNMPNSFPFAETPFIEQAMSRQISRDLGEGLFLPPDIASTANTLTQSSDVDSSIGWLRRLFGRTLGMLRGGPPPYRADAWTLPAVDEADVKALAETYKHINLPTRSQTVKKASKSPKRKASGSPTRPQAASSKRARVDDYEEGSSDD